jgi:beta-lactam-binding protein with PASTA domain
VSSGPSTVVVQNVVGDSQAAAVSTLQGQNLAPVVVCQATTDPTQDGIVQSQTPLGGQTVSVGSTVTITVDSVSGCSDTTTTSSTTTTTQ